MSDRRWRLHHRGAPKAHTGSTSTEEPTISAGGSFRSSYPVSASSTSHRARECCAMIIAAGQVRPLTFLNVFINSPRSTNRQCPAKLIIAGRTAESLTSNLGARCARPINGKKGALEARAIWSHEFGPAVMGRLAMATTGGTFTVAGVPINRDALALGAGISNECAGTSCSSPTTVPSWTAAGRPSSPSMRDCGRRGRQPAGRHVGCLVSLLH